MRTSNTRPSLACSLTAFVLLGVSTFGSSDSAQAQDVALVTNIGQPYTWYDDHGQKGFDLPGDLTELSNTDFFPVVGQTIGLVGGFIIGGTLGGPGGALAGGLAGAGAGHIAGETIADFLKAIDDTHDTHTHPFGIWIGGGLAQEFTTGSNSFGYDLSSIAIYGRYYPGLAIEVPLSISVWSSSNGFPGSLLYTLPYSKWVSDGSYGLRLEYQAPVPGVLERGTRYFIVIGYLDETRVVITSSPSEDSVSLAGWSIGNSLRKRIGEGWRTLTPADAGRKVFPADKMPVLRTEVRGTSLNSKSIIVSLTKVGEGLLKATATASTPFDVVLPLNVTSGSAASSVTIPANSTESDVVTVFRTPGTTFPVTVDIGDLPNVPEDHPEYTLFKSPRPPLQVIDSVQGGFTPVCDRTAHVRDVIVRASPVSSCGEVTEAHLAAITTLNANWEKGSSRPLELQTGDFSGLTALTTLRMGRHAHGFVLPDRIFDGLVSLKELDLYLAGPFTAVPDAVLGLTSLENLNLGYNGLTSLPAGTFDRLTQLTSLDLGGNNLGALPLGIFDHLTELQRLNLEYAKITSLPDGIFDHLTSLTHLNLDGLRSASLPDAVFFWLASLKSLSLRDTSLGSLSGDVFSGLSGLTYLGLSGNRFPLAAGLFDGLSTLTSLRLARNQLTSLPAGIFGGLSSLTSLHLERNPVDPLPITVTLELVEKGRFKATAHTGAPFPIILLLNITNGSMGAGASTLTIPTGRVDSDTVSVTRSTGTTDPVTVDIRTLPSLPTDVNQYGTTLHLGYTLVKSPDLPLEILSSGESGTTSPEGSGESGTTIPVGNRLEDREIALHADNLHPFGIWSDGTTMWVADSPPGSNEVKKVYAYTLSDGTRQTDMEFDFPGSYRNYHDIWSDGTTMWVTDPGGGKVYAYALSDGTRQDGTNGTTDMEFELHAANRRVPMGIWSDGTTMWVTDTDGKVYAYTLATGNRDTDKEFELHADTNTRAGIWSDGTMMWNVDFGWNNVYAYALSDGTRQDGTNGTTDMEFELHADNFHPWGIWSDGTTMWVTDHRDAMIYAYYVSDLTTVSGTGTPPTQAQATTDFNGDGKTDFVDFFLFIDAYGGTDSRFDLDGSGTVDFVDFFQFVDAFDQSGQAKLLVLAQEMLGLPSGTELEQNLPNPFNSETVISWFLLEPGPARIEVFSLTGQRVAVLQEGPLKAGRYRVHWNARDDTGRPLASGVYLYRLATDQGVRTRKLTLLR